jgi:hypothetical protein
MSKLVESFITDAMNRVNTPEVQTLLQKNVFGPILSALLEFLAPYLLGIGILWALMFIGIFTILVLLLRSPVVRVQ